jgi:hypothetical protein
MCRELERLIALAPWLATTLHSRERRRDRAPRQSREIARQVRLDEERRLYGLSR